jgi:hypothetical protein
VHSERVESVSNDSETVKNRLLARANGGKNDTPVRSPTSKTPIPA